MKNRTIRIIIWGVEILPILLIVWRISTLNDRLVELEKYQKQIVDTTVELGDMPPVLYPYGVDGVYGDTLSIEIEQLWNLYQAIDCLSRDNRDWLIRLEKWRQGVGRR